MCVYFQRSISKLTLLAGVLCLLFQNNISAQTFTFPSSEQSSILTGSNIYSHGTGPDTVITWCQDFDLIENNLTTWGGTFKLKSNDAFVKFKVNNLYLATDYNKKINYTYRLAFTAIGFTNPTDTLHTFTTNNDTLTISYNNLTDNTPYQDEHWKKYSGYYKLMVIVNAVLIDTGGTLATATLSDTAWRNYSVEASILTQHYDKTPYGIGTGVQVPVIYTVSATKNYIDLKWDTVTTVSPVNYELEWTYVDDYIGNYPQYLYGATASSLTTSQAFYNFDHNSTRVWLDSNGYRLPLTYSSGYVVYRVRYVRPDSTLFKYPVYGAWSSTSSTGTSIPDNGYISALTAGNEYVHTSAYTGDSLNWQYTVSFAEGGRYKQVASFYDGLLKNRQSITRFNSNLNKLIVTDNVYDYEGRPSIKTLPAPVYLDSAFSYVHNVDIDSLTGAPYQASGFDSGLANCPDNAPIAPFKSNAFASIYYSHANPDQGGFQQFVPDAQGYPFVQTVYQPGFTDRVQFQGGAGPRLQIGDTNFISNSYVSPGQQDLDAIFGPNVGWSSYYRMTVTSDPNQQLSMTIKDYEGRQMASAMIGPGPNSTTHAITSTNVPSPVFYKQDLLLPAAPNQSVDTINGTKTVDNDYFNEAGGNDSLKYNYTFIPYAPCPGQYVYVKGHYNCEITDQCGNLVKDDTATMGYNGVGTSETPVNYTDSTYFYAQPEQYHVHKSLSFTSGDITAALDSFFNVASCYRTENSFIQQSVDSTVFPCPGNVATDSSDCARMRWEMIQQLLPGAIYGQYSMSGSEVYGNNNSIFTLNCPPDTFWVTRYNIGIGNWYHYKSMTSDITDTTKEYIYIYGVSEEGVPSYTYYYSTLYATGDSIKLDDTAINVIGFGIPSFTENAQITINYDWEGITDTYIDSIYGKISGPGITGTIFINSSGENLDESTDIRNQTPPESIMGSVSPVYFESYPISGEAVISVPITVTGDSIFANIAAFFQDDDKYLYITIKAAITSYSDSEYTFPIPYITDSLSGFDSASIACGYRYQNSCTSLPDTITVAGITYHDLRTMPADSFIMVYNGAIAQGNYSIAEDLLPLHPQYCELQSCFNDTFKTEVEAIPTWQAAQGMGLLLLDSLISHDPIKALMTSSGLFPNPTDSLKTFPGGLQRLDTFILMAAYCSSPDSVVFAQCVAGMFANEIKNHLLINSAVENYYFNNIISAYFSNRQLFVDKILMSGSGCSNCAANRMTLDSAAAIPPVAYAPSDTTTGDDSAFTGGASSGWAYGLSGSSNETAMYDSAMAALHYTDSMLVAGEVDTIMAHLSGCLLGSSSLYTRISDSLISLYNSGAANLGNFTYPQIEHVLLSNGVHISELCNPYLLDCTQFGSPPPTPVNDCKSATLYSDMSTYMNTSAVISALQNPGTPYSFTMSMGTNSFENYIGLTLGNNSSTIINASYTSADQLYELKVYTTAPSGSGDTAKIFLHSNSCSNAFGSGGPFASGTTFSISISCLNSFPSLASTSGLIGEYCFVATVSSASNTCNMTGWNDSVQTMTYMNNAVSQCVPCTQIRSLYTQFNDTLKAYGIYGTDHPYYDVMLANFMNYNLGVSYSSDNYETFIQSCALADSMQIPVYSGYATYKFTNTTDMNSFIYMMDHVDTNYIFDNSYRDSTMDGTSIITVGIDLSAVPQYELWKYKDTLKNYTGSYHSRVIDTPFVSQLNTGEIGFIYSSVSTLLDSNIIDTTTTVKFKTPYQKAVWTAGHFVAETFYDVVATAAPAYTISQDVYKLSGYFYTHGVPGIFVPGYMSTINADYFKAQKQAYLQFVYSHQQLPEYQVLDSIQAQFLTTHISSYVAAGYQASYTQPFSGFVPSNLYLFTAGMINRDYDTLEHIITLASTGVSTGAIFRNALSTPVYSSGSMALNEYLCSDGSYWLRYFTTGDTLFNVYIALPSYIPAWQRSSYKVVGNPILTGGDSLNRYFMLDVVLSGTTDTLQASGMTDFVIAKTIELDNVLLGQTNNTSGGSTVDTFDNCERQTLASAIDAGIVNYNNYLDSVKSAVYGTVVSNILDSAKEKLMLGYMNDEFQYTLYNYDRAGNLVFTVPPAGSVSLLDTGAQLNRVDTSRILNTTTGPAPAYTKINVYNYNSLNLVDQQTTIDGNTTRFMYDAAGRLIFSQNAKQAPNGYYTYNIYDNQNRIIETGEAHMGCNYFTPYSSGFSTPLDPPACYYSYFISSTTYDEIGGPPYIVYNYLISPDPYFVQMVANMSYDSVVNYIHTFNRDDVVMTIYDTAATKLNTIKGLDSQQNLRQRVSCVKYFENLMTSDHAYKYYNYATHYSYDIDGNVQTLTQDFPALATSKQQYKRIDYDYDLVSGKVNMLSYNRGWPDQYYQQYNYDADNRITTVKTSSDGFIWHTDAQYQYYEHGPLARTVLGDQAVQGVDYAYTIQGWLKIMNSDTLNNTMDMGGDGAGTANSPDAVAYAIDYFKNDYKPISGATMQHVAAPMLELFNGNIVRQTSAIDSFQRLNKQYIYDQLNRIQSATYASINPATYVLTGLTDFHNNYTYDKDGNIQKLVRYGNNLPSSGVHIMDSLIYTYTATGADDKLVSLNDYAPAGYYTNDIAYTGATSKHYSYDAIGNTIKDMTSAQDTIQWNLYNKVVNTQNNAAGNSMQFEYDGAGNRVAKHLINLTDTGTLETNEYYVHDAQGNILAIYKEQDDFIQVPVILVSLGDPPIRSAMGGSVPFDANFVVPTYGGNAGFQQKVFNYSLANSSFSSPILSLSPAWFMNNSSTLYANMINGSTAYMGALVRAQSGQQGGEEVSGDTIVCGAMTAMFNLNPGGFNTCMGQLFNNPPATTELLSQLCSVAKGDTLLYKMAVALGQHPPSYVCTAIDNSISNAHASGMAMANAFSTVMQLYPASLSQYMNQLAADQTLYNNQAINGIFYSMEQQALTNFAIKDSILQFFGSWSGSVALMNSMETSSQLLAINYNVNPTNYISTFDADLGDTYIDTAIASATGFTYAAYLSSEFALTGTTASSMGLTETALKYQDFSLAEHDIYGSSRLGVKDYYDLQVGFASAFNPSTYVTTWTDTQRLWTQMPWYSLQYQDVINIDSTNLYGNTFTDAFFVQHSTGQKQYELTDHLGDVLATICDKRAVNTYTVIPGTTLTTGSPALVNTWKPIVVSAYDYYPFGEYMPSRYFADSTSNCYNTTISEMVPSTYLVWEPLVPLFSAGIITPIMPVTTTNNGSSLTFTATAQAAGFSLPVSNVPAGSPTSLQLSVTSLSGEFLAQVIDSATQDVVGSLSLTSTQGNGTIFTVPFTSPSGSVRVSVTNEVNANSILVITGFWVPRDTLIPENVVASVCNIDQYRYGFNGQMKVNEWAGLGNHNTAEFWEYDTRTARRANLDPVPQTSSSNYAAFANSPIRYNDPLGNTIDETQAVQSDQANKTNVTGNLNNDLKNETGLVLTVNEKNDLVYAKDKDGNAIVSKDANGKEIGSPTARKELIGAINSTETATLTYNYGRESVTDDKSGIIGIDPLQVMNFTKGSVNLNDKTMGLGMTFLHELSHTKAGGDLSDDKSSFGAIGDVENRMNNIRKELGSSFGQRLSYTARTMNNGQNYIPFSKEAFNDIDNDNQYPAGSYVKFKSEGQNNAATRKDDVIKSMQYYRDLIK